jgi:hypothetical protein
VIRETKKLRLVNKAFPLIFWQFCEVCKKDFVREWGWSSTIGGEGWHTFICLRCAPTREEAQKLFEELPGKPWLDIIREGKVKKGGRNSPPKTPRPNAKPIALKPDRDQGGCMSEEIICTKNLKLVAHEKMDIGKFFALLASGDLDNFSVGGHEYVRVKNSDRDQGGKEFIW